MPTLSLNGHNYTVVTEQLLPRGTRAYVRRRRPAQQSDPSMPQVATWQIHGPIGASREGPDGFLGHDYGTLETRYDQLLTSLGAVSTLTVSGSDPLASGSAALGAMPLGGRALGGGSSLSAPSTITHIKESGSYLFLGRGAFVTQVNPSTWAVTATKAISAVVRGMEVWFDKLRIGVGGTKAIQTVTGITTTGATYTDTQVSGSDTNGKAMVRGNDRLWWVRADSAGTNENRLRYTLDDFSSQSTGFVVGDPGVNATGVGTMGPYTVTGSETGIFGFTDEGIPFNMVTSLRDARSTENGRVIADHDNAWSYATSALGLFALRPGLRNQIGIGSESMSGFEGFDGKPTAALSWRSSLLVCYEDSAGTTWRILRGVYGPATDGTGELLWYPFASRSNASVRALGATSTPTLPTIVWGEGANTLARIAQGRGGRDILDASYSFSTAGGTWFGTTTMRRPHLRKTIRWGRFTTENMASGNTWQLAVSTDGGSYANVGAAVTAAGVAKVVPSPLAYAPTGYTIKPRLTQVAGAGSAGTTPPQIRGALEIGYDERPDYVTEVVTVLNVTHAELLRLEALADADELDGRTPVEIRLPDEPRPSRFGYVVAVEDQDLTAPEVTGATVTIVLVDTD